MDADGMAALILGGGGAALVTAVVAGARSIQAGIKARDTDALKTVVEQRNQAVIDRREALYDREHTTEERDYWRNRAGELEYLCRRHGIEYAPSRPPPAVRTLPSDALSVVGVEIRDHAQ